MKITDRVQQLVLPIVQAHGCRLWDVEYVREGDQRFLRLYIDKEVISCTVRAPAIIAFLISM